MTRSALDALYRGCGALAALFLVAIAVLILAQIIGRLLGVVVPSAAEFAGYSMAASSFLALAYTLRAGGQIRVNLVLQRLSPRARRSAEIWSLSAAAFLTAYFAFFAGQMTWESYVFRDVCPGLIPAPLWIPQSAMVLGLVVLFIACLDDLVTVLKGRPASYEGKGESLLEQPLRPPDEPR